MASSIKKMITLRSSDGEAFVVEDFIAMESQTIKHTIENDCADSGIPLPNITGKILSKVIEDYKKHVESSQNAEELKTWDVEYIRVDMDTLYCLILAANYLNIKGFLDQTCQTMADMIKGKCPEQIREKFNIKNKFTPEEEEI